MCYIFRNKIIIAFTHIYSLAIDEQGVLSLEDSEILLKFMNMLFRYPAYFTDSVSHLLTINAFINPSLNSLRLRF